ncbi:MAG: hypothetical protein ACC657_18040 [Thiohalomonadales bacterium]
MRKILAFVIAPLTPAALQIILPVMISQSWPFNQTDYKIIIAVSTITSFIGLFIIGIPLIIWLRKINRLSITNLSLAGVLSGAVIFYLFWLLLGLALQTSAIYGVYPLIYGSTLGFVVAFTFGMVSGITNRSRNGTREELRAP